MMLSYSSSRTSILILIMSRLSYLAGPSNPSAFIFSIAELVISLVPAISDRQLRASTRLLSFPSVYTILNLYYLRSSVYRTCLRFRVLVIVKLTKFLWSESITRSEQLSAYIL
jgi:hypothetical protein